LSSFACHYGKIYCVLLNKYFIQENQVENVFTRHTINENIKIEDEGIVYDYDKIIDMVNRWHTVFKQCNLKKGDRIAVGQTQTAAHITLFIAVAEYGLEYFALPLAYMQGPDPRFDLEKSQIKMTFIDTKIAQIYWWDIPSFFIPDIDNIPPDRDVKIDVVGSDVILRGLTAGTTNNMPRELYYPHEKLMHSSKISAELFYKSTDRVLMYTSVNHLGMITMQFMPTLLAGSYIVIHRVFLGEEMFTLLKEKNINKTIMFPMTIQVLKNSALWENSNFDTLEEVLAGGSVLNKEFVQTLFNKGIKQVNNVYGLTEALPPMFFAKVTKDNLDSMYTFDGKPKMGDLVPGWEIRIGDDNCLYVKGPGRAEIAENELESDGFYNTKDLVEFIDGAYVCYGRQDRYARIDGILTNLSMIERKLMLEHPVKNVVVFERNERLNIACNFLDTADVKLVVSQIKEKWNPYEIRFDKKAIFDRIK
jgi:acyl-coenzyme A synthetase/AMP-(fatty) acid ligase